MKRINLILISAMMALCCSAVTPEQMMKAAYDSRCSVLDSLRVYNSSVTLTELSPIVLAGTALSSPYSKEFVDAMVEAVAPIATPDNGEAVAILELLQGYPAYSDGVKKMLVALQNSVDRLDKKARIDYSKIAGHIMSTPYADNVYRQKWNVSPEGAVTQVGDTQSIGYLDRVLTAALIEVSNAANGHRNPNFNIVIKML